MTVILILSIKVYLIQQIINKSLNYSALCVKIQEEDLSLPRFFSAVCNTTL